MQYTSRLWPYRLSNQYLNDEGICFNVNTEAKFWGKETVRIANEFGYVECVDTYRFWIRWSSDCN